MTTAAIQANHTSISFDESGEGETVILLHSSGCSRHQWRGLAAILEDDHRLLMPDLHGYGESGSWHGRRPIRMADQASLVGALIERAGGPVHLVGHSYGGAVALRAAFDHGDCLSSLTLIEPTAFHLFREDLDACRPHFDEICGLSDAIGTAVIRGDTWRAMARFVDYWNGPGSWQAMSESRRQRLADCAGQVALDFWSALSEDKRLADLRDLEIPSLVLCGTNSPAPVREISRMLTENLPSVRHRTLSNVGHMAPLTHPAVVASQLIPHFLRNTALSELERRLSWAEELHQVMR